MSASIIPFILFFLFSKESHSFIFQQCNDAAPISECLPSNDDFYDEEDLTLEFLNNNATYTNIYINGTDKDLEINIDSFSGYTFHFLPGEYSITIKTDLISISEEFQYPIIDAANLDLIIDNTNPITEKINYTVFCHSEISYKSLAPKNEQKPLYLLSKPTQSLIPSINTDFVYIGNYGTIELLEEISQNLTILHSPVPASEIGSNSTYYYNRNFTLISPENLTIKYGTKRIDFLYPNNLCVTFICETERSFVDVHLKAGTVVTVNNETSGADLIFPHLYSFHYFSEEEDPLNITADRQPIIEGTWPIVKPRIFQETTLNDGSFVDYFEYFVHLEGTFYFKANNFPANYFVKPTILITESESSFYFYEEVAYFYDDLRILDVTNKDDEKRLIMNGVSVYYDLEYIYTNSSHLTIYANAVKNVNIIGPSTFLLRTIDNSDGYFTKSAENSESTLNFTKGGAVITPYLTNFDDILGEMYDAYDEYINKNPIKEDASVSTKANNIIKFIQRNIQILNKLNNSILNLDVALKDGLENMMNRNSTISIARRDIPLTAFYKQTQDQLLDILCIEENEEETLNLSNWNTRIQYKFTMFSFMEHEDYSFIDRFLPSFSDSSIKGEFVLNNNDTCIAFHQTDMPGSTFEIFVYTTNATFRQMAENIEFITLLTSEDLDAAGKKMSEKTKNYVVLVLDDLPENSAINLKGIRMDSNIFLVGFKSNKIEDVFQLAQEISNVNNSQDMHELLKEFVSNETELMPSASVTFDSVQTFAVFCVNYVGTHIKCTNFYAFLSDFPNLGGDFSATTTLTETLTLTKMSNVHFNDLVLLPVSNDPLNILTVESINFTSDKWTFTLNGIFNDDGFKVEKSQTYEIETSTVGGSLTVYSYKSGYKFVVSEGTESVKAIKLNSHFSNINVKEIPGIMILDDNEEVQKTAFYEGPWDKVKNIDGTFEINAGDQPVVIEKIPEIVAQNLVVRSTNNVNLSLLSDNFRVTQRSVINGPKEISYSNDAGNLNVSFSSILFSGENSVLNLILNKQPDSTVVVDEVIISSETNAKVTGNLTVNDAFKYGYDSSLEASNINSENPLLIIDYRLLSPPQIPSTFDDIEPREIKLNYTGESDNYDDFIDYSSYSDGYVREVKRFNGNLTKCQNWIDKTNLESTYYPEFRGENAVVQLFCENSTDSTYSSLMLNLTAIPTGVVEVPQPDQIIFPSNKKKKKLSVGAIVGIVIAAVVLIAIISLLIWYFAFYKKKKNLPTVSENEDDSVGL